MMGGVALQLTAEKLAELPELFRLPDQKAQLSPLLIPPFVDSENQLNIRSPQKR